MSRTFDPTASWQEQLETAYRVLRELPPSRVDVGNPGSLYLLLARCMEMTVLETAAAERICSWLKEHDLVEVDRRSGRVRVFIAHDNYIADELNKDDHRPRERPQARPILAARDLMPLAQQVAAGYHIHPERLRSILERIAPLQSSLSGVELAEGLTRVIFELLEEEGRKR